MTPPYDTTMWVPGKFQFVENRTQKHKGKAHIVLCPFVMHWDHLAQSALPSL